MLTNKQKSTVIKQAKATAAFMRNGVQPHNGWARVCLMYKGSQWTPSKKEIDRLVDALSIHFDGIAFASTDIGAHIEIACSDVRVVQSANEYIAGWLAK